MAKTKLSGFIAHSFPDGQCTACKWSEESLLFEKVLAYTGKDDWQWHPSHSMHPNKHIREALKYAQQHGWRIVMSRGHAYCRIYCGQGHRDCKKSVWSTPRNPEAHAKDIRDKVDSCPGAAKP